MHRQRRRRSTRVLSACTRCGARMLNSSKNDLKIARFWSGFEIALLPGATSGRAPPLAPVQLRAFGSVRYESARRRENKSVGLLLYANAPSAPTPQPSPPFLSPYRTPGWVP